MSVVRAVVTGAGGLLGSALCRSAPAGVDVVGLIRDSPAPEGIASRRVELSDPVDVADAFADVDADVVIHTAYGKTDFGRDIERATEVVANECAARDVSLVHLSTDAVFDGDHPPFDEGSEPRPVHAYGRAKLAAERAVVAAVPDATVIRTSLILSADGTDGTSAWMLADLEAGRRVTLFDDEIRWPILVDDLAAMIWELVGRPRSERAGVWHLMGAERLSRVELGRLWCEAASLAPDLIDVAHSADLAEARPRNLTLTSLRAGSLSATPRPVGSVIGHGQTT